MGKSDVWVRLFSTGTIADLVSRGSLPMLRPGLGDAGDFNIGVIYPNESSSGIGHMAGTLGGLNVESRGGYGVLLGAAARGATNPLFRHHFHVKIDAIGAEIPQLEEDEFMGFLDLTEEEQDKIIDRFWMRYGRGEKVDGTFPDHMVGVSGKKIMEMLNLMRMGDAGAEGDTHPQNLDTLYRQSTEIRDDLAAVRAMLESRLPPA
jgi:hypothetical protein